MIFQLHPLKSFHYCQNGFKSTSHRFIDFRVQLSLYFYHADLNGKIDRRFKRILFWILLRRIKNRKSCTSITRFSHRQLTIELWSFFYSIETVKNHFCTSSNHQEYLSHNNCSYCIEWIMFNRNFRDFRHPCISYRVSVECRKESLYSL